MCPSGVLNIVSPAQMTLVQKKLGCCSLCILTMLFVFLTFHSETSIGEVSIRPFSSRTSREDNLWHNSLVMFWLITLSRIAPSI